MFGFEIPRVDVVAVRQDVYQGDAGVALASPPGGLVDITSNRRLTVIAGQVVDADCHASPDTNPGTYQTWRPITPPCPYFGD